MKALFKRLWNFLGHIEDLKMKCMKHTGWGKF